MIWKSYKEKPASEFDIILARVLNSCGDEEEITSTVKSFVWDGNKRSVSTFTVDCWKYIN